MCVDSFAHRWRTVFVCIVDVTPFALSDFALGLMILVLDDCSFAFNGVSFIAYNGVRAVGRCGRCPTDIYFVGDAVLVNGQRLLSNANSAIWSTRRWQQLAVSRFFRRQIVYTHRE